MGMNYSQRGNICKMRSGWYSQRGNEPRTSIYDTDWTGWTD